MAVTFRVSSYSDPTGSFTSQQSLVTALIQAAGDQIGQYLSCNAVIDVAVTVDETITGSTIAQAGPAGVITEGPRAGGGNILETTAAAEIRTGVDQNGTTAEINVTLTKLFFNQSSSYLGLTDAVPSGRFDAISVLTHEMMHGIAFTGYLSNSDFVGNSIRAQTYYSDYDTQLSSANGKPYFTGKVTEIVYGGALPLTPTGGSSIYHVDSSTTALARDLMAPVATNGARLGLSDYDLAIFRDLGLPVTKTLVSPDGHTFVPGYGNVTVQGTAGLDTAVELGARSTYTATRAGSTVAVTGTDGTDTLIDIERVKFDDQTIAFDTGLGQHAGEAYRLYQAAFNRTADSAGLGYWIRVLDGGTPNWAVAQAFAGSSEFARTYGSLDNTGFVTQLYQNILHRAPDAGGLAYYQNLLNSGVGTRGDVLAGFSESNENQVALAGVLHNGVTYTG